MAVTEQAARRTVPATGSGTSMVPRTSTLIASPDCPAVVTDAYLTLRTNLEFALLGTPGTVLMGAPLDGSVEAAQVMANLAIALAASGDQVLVVDCNLHEPSLHSMFELPNDTGLRDLLHQTWADHDLPAQPTGVLPNLHVITAGLARPGSLSIAATNELAETVIRLKGLTERLILMGPPLLSYPDSLTLCPYVDGLFVVVSPRKARRDALARARALLARVNAPLIGAVVLDESRRG